MDLKSFLAGVLLSVVLSCVSPGAPEWHGKLYHGNPDKVGIERTQDGEFIPASDEKFGDYFCTSSNDLAELIKIVQSCKKW